MFEKLYNCDEPRRMWSYRGRKISNGQKNLKFNSFGKQDFVIFDCYVKCTNKNEWTATVFDFGSECKSMFSLQIWFLNARILMIIHNILSNAMIISSNRYTHLHYSRTSKRYWFIFTFCALQTVMTTRQLTFLLHQFNQWQIWNNFSIWWWQLQTEIQVDSRTVL